MRDRLEPRGQAAQRRPVWPLACALIALIGAGAGSNAWDRRGLPAPRAATAALSDFSEARVLRAVDVLCAGGPRPTGSATEAAAFEVRGARRLPNWRWRQPQPALTHPATSQYASERFKAAAAAAAAAGRGVRVDVDRRVGSGGVRYVGGPGARPRASRGGAAAPEPPAEGTVWSDALYSDLDVLVARVTPGGSSVGMPASALLLSVHVDTQWNTEGATDNSVHMATLLELLDAVVAGCATQRSKPFASASPAQRCTAAGAHGAHS